METIRFTNDRVGNVTWRLPPNIADQIGSLSEHQKNAVLDTIAMLIDAQMLVLLTTLQLGKKTGKGFELLRQTQLKLSSELMQLARQ